MSLWHTSPRNDCFLCSEVNMEPARTSFEVTSVVGQVKSQHAPSFAIYASCLLPVRSLSFAVLSRMRPGESYRTGVAAVGCSMGPCITPAFASAERWQFCHRQGGRGWGGLVLNRGNCCLKTENPKQNWKFKQATFARYLYGEGFSWRMWLELIYIYFPWGA